MVGSSSGGKRLTGAACGRHAIPIATFFRLTSLPEKAAPYLGVLGESRTATLALLSTGAGKERTWPG